MSQKFKHRGHRDDDDSRYAFDDYRIVLGGAGSNTYAGSSRMDVAFGRAGNDDLSGRFGDDDLLGGIGNDVLSGGAGMDHLDGGSGRDVLRGGDESDNLRGGAGNDRLDEGAGHGDLEGEEGDDVLAGGPGGDAFVIAPGSGNDVITDFAAGPGMLDHLAVRGLNAEDLRFVDTRSGVRISWDEGESSVLLKGVFKEDLAQDDFMFTDDREVIRPTSAAAEEVMSTKFALNEGDAALPPIFSGNDPASDTFRFDEFLAQVGANGRDTFRGTDARDYFFGLGGADRLSGLGGDDDLRGGDGADVLVGGMGQDHLKGGADGDRLFGGDQADSLMGEDGRDALYAGAGHDMLEGGRGDDTLDGGDGADAFIVAPDSGNDVVVGGFDAGPGAFDHIAFRDLTPAQVDVRNSTRDGAGGVLVSWNTDADAKPEGSIFLVGLRVDEMAQDDFMFDADNGLQGAFENNAKLQVNGSEYIFQDDLL